MKTNKRKQSEEQDATSASKHQAPPNDSYAAQLQAMADNSPRVQRAA